MRDEAIEAFDEDPFLNYATVFWPFHARHVESLLRYRDLVINFLHGQPEAAYQRRQKNSALEIDASPSTHKIMCTSLYYAALFGFPSVVETLLVMGSYLTPDDKGCALLGAVIGGSNENIIKRLLKENIIINIRKSSGFTALHLAVHNTDLTEKLLSHYADSPLVTSSVVAQSSWSALHVAALYGQIEVAKILLANGADLMLPAGIREYTPLHIATWYRNTELIMLFLTQINKVGLHSSAVDSRETPFHDEYKLNTLDARVNRLLGEVLSIHPLEIYTMLLKAFPDDYILYEFAGDCYFENKIYDTAYELYHNGLSLKVIKFHQRFDTR